MENAATTDSLRALAPKWSLAGDDQLLNLLESTHQRIISKCQDVNSKLEEMSAALEDATINLQNVNNKFMALNNSQFIESRVYDDDMSEVVDTPPHKEISQPPPLDELSIIKNSLAILERAHEMAEILDDSDSDSDMEISLVLKPKDMYSHRPLPYVIGSQQWKNKWHAGLVVEESDSDSCTSRRDVSDIEQYSDTASEAEEQTRPHAEDQTISETSSSFTSEQPVENTPPVKQKPSDIAAELARRLGGPLQAVEQEADVFTPPVPTTRKVYKPEQPAISAIFSDEPPPLTIYESDDTRSEDEDIFAEINKNKPYTQQRNTVQNNLAEDLFSFDKPYEIEQGDIFSDFAAGNVATKPSTHKSTLFEDESEPELFAEPLKKEVIKNNNNTNKEVETSTKKPVGGISLFGSNKGAESIGAAILKRNRRKSSTSGDESGSDKVKSRNDEEKPKVVPKISTEKSESVARSKNIYEIDNKSLNKKEKDIFDDLFAKSEKSEKKPSQEIAKDVPVKVSEKKNVKDLFSDNIFDDIDDIFTSNVKIPVKDSKQKSIFDDDDDDLFSDIAKPKTVNQATTSNDTTNIKNKKSLFDSDDDLFSDIKTEKSTVNFESQKPLNTTDENDSEVSNKAECNLKSTETTKQIHIYDNSPKQNVPKIEIKPQIKTKGIFDSESDEDIFANIKISKDKKTNNNEIVPNTNQSDTKPVDSELFKQDSKLLVSENIESKEKSSIVQSPSLFEEDEIDDLFINANKSIENVSVKPKETKIAEVENISSDLKGILLKNTNAEFETKSISNEESKKKLPKVLKESEHKVIGALPQMPSIETVEKADIYDNNEQEDDDSALFSAQLNQGKNNKNVADAIVPKHVIESSQEAKSQVVGANTINPETNDNTQTPEIATDINKQDINRSFFDDFNETIKEKKVLASQQKKPISNEPSVFDDIFTEPPVFEKLSEPKRSKNVNALFDDDSDDESLFFKKNEVISDEKPELFSENAKFDIIVDEPPAIDVDYTANASQNLADDDNDIFRIESKIDESVPTSTKNIELNTDQEFFSTVSKIKDSLIPKASTSDVKTDVPKKSDENSKTKEKKNLFPENDEELFSTPEVEKDRFVTKVDEITVITVDKTGIDSDEDLFSSLPKPKVPKSRQKEQPEQIKTLNSNKNKREDDLDDIFKSTGSPKKETEVKKIGKIDTKNFNINVNALMPGASPKKVKPMDLKNDDKLLEHEENVPKMVKLFATNDETDNTQSKSLSPKKENEKTSEHQVENETKQVKSITFEEKPESEVLDNNASKKRAKIQVKRRPSSRRARHEAVRKSAIDLSDETDNSSSFDEPISIKNQNIAERKGVDIQKVDKARLDNTNAGIENNQTIDIVEKTDQDSKTNTFIERKEGTANESKINASNMPSHSNTDKYENNQNEKLISSEIGTETNKNKKNDVQEPKSKTTKVVYVLNDEDIFNTPSKSIESNDDIFGSKKVTSDNIFGGKELAKEPIENVKDDLNATKKVAESSKKDEIINVKDAKTLQNAKTALFDDSDEELFKKSAKTIKSSSIFDSDSEEDLFSGKKRTEKESKEQKNQEVKKKEVKVKGSLFGDEDDDDDLFGVKKDKTESKQSSIPSTSKEGQVTTASKSVEPVFDDPLSMLGDDD